MPETVFTGDPPLTQPLKVWHVVGPMNHGGAEVMVMELLRHKSPETQVDFLVHQRKNHISGSAAFDDEIIARGAQLLPITTPVQSGLRTYFHDFQTLIKANGKPDVIHIHLNARSGLVALAARRNGIKRIIVHSHAALTFRGSFAYRLFANAELMVSKIIFAAFATDYWGCSPEAISSLFMRWPSRGQPRVVINNAIDAELYLSVEPKSIKATRKDLLGGNSGLLIGTVGRIVRHKNADFLVSVLAELHASGVKATLALVGREQDVSYCDEIRAETKKLGLNTFVRFISERNDIALVMAALDVFVGPALKEGFGLVALEAQAARTPSVLSPGFPNNVDLQIGLVHRVESYNAREWAKKVENAYNIARPEKTLTAHAIAEYGFSARENTLRIEKAWRDPAFRPGEQV